MTGARPRMLSLATIVVLWTAIVVLVMCDPPANVLSWDTFGYYLYLPATLLHGDVGMQDQAWVQHVLGTYHNSGTFYQAQELPDGHWVMKYPMGSAVLWSPFFVVGHLIAGHTGYPQDGFSAPYQWAIIGASLLYILLGLWVLRKVLLHFFPDRIAAAVLALLVLGTNYLHQSLFASGMPHTLLFTLYAGILWRSIRWHADHRRRDVVLLAVLMGLAMLCRPSEMVCLLIPLLVGLGPSVAWREHLNTLHQYRSQLVLAAVVLALIGLPQFIYWKWLTGAFFYMSYNNPGEGFEFLHPYVWEVLFSARKGWYLYTPLMLVATFGLFALRDELAHWRWALIGFVALNIFIVGSWSCWWYAESFGQRAFVQSYAVMALPLGAALQWMQQRRTRLAMGTFVVLCLVALNLFQTYQSVHGLIHPSRMTWRAYKAVLGRTTPPADLPGLLLVDRSSDQGEHPGPDLRDYRMVPFLTMGFDAPFTGMGSTRRRDTLSFEGAGAFLMTPDSALSPAIHCAWERLTTRDHLWLQVRCAVHLPHQAEGRSKVRLITSFRHAGYDYGTRFIYADPAAVDTNGWARVSYWYLTPEVRRPTDELFVRAELQEGSPTLVDEIEVTLYEPITRY